MTICLQIFGEFRSFQKNLRKNILELKKIYDSPFDIYILSDKSGNYSTENERKIRKIFVETNCKVKMLKYWDELEEHHSIENDIQQAFDKECLHKRGYHPFMKKMWYRRYVLNSLVKEEYETYIFARLFDTEIYLLKNPEYTKTCIDNWLKDDLLVFGLDHFFIGTKKIFNKLFEFGLVKTAFGDEMWDRPLFSADYLLCDYVLFNNRDTYSSELQLFYYIFMTMPYIHIRLDYNNKYTPLNRTALFYLHHCPDRLIN